MNSELIALRVKFLFIRDGRSVRKLSHSREDFMRLYSIMGFTGITLNEIQHFSIFSGIELVFFFHTFLFLTPSEQV